MIPLKPLDMVLIHGNGLEGIIGNFVWQGAHYDRWMPADYLYYFSRWNKLTQMNCGTPYCTTTMQMQ